MVQFKPVFLGFATSDDACDDLSKCARTTTSHHRHDRPASELIRDVGNFSFGDYSRASVRLGIRFSTEVLGWIRPAVVLDL
jgi:alanyl-tRNA synthetase